MLKAIETFYRGYRFRSRTEARRAVFFDAAGIEWKYELEGFDVNGRYYLPDFWLPHFKMFVEVKPDTTACEAAEPLMRELVLASGHCGLLIAGGPNIEEPPEMIHVWQAWDKTTSVRAAWAQCQTCNHVTIRKFGFQAFQCDCTFPNITVVKHQDCSSDKGGSLRVEHALEQAQWARFEHGEDGSPEAYFADDSIVRVYVAGAVLDDENSALLPWRAQIFGDGKPEIDGNYRYGAVGRFQYAGPSILISHGQALDTLANDCMSEVYRSNVLFAWIDRHEQIGTIAEIGYAFAYRKPIFIAFADQDLCRHFYLIEQLATVTIIAPDAVSAWRFFEQWQTP